MADQLREKIARLVASCGIPEYAKDEIWAEDLPMWIRRRERTDRPSQDNPFGLADAILALFREEGVDLEGWRPIETLPDDCGPWLLALYVQHVVNPGTWEMYTVTIDEDSGEINEDTGWNLSDFTHWRPLPKGPAHE